MKLIKIVNDHLFFILNLNFQKNFQIVEDEGAVDLNGMQKGNKVTNKMSFGNVHHKIICDSELQIAVFY